VRAVAVLASVSALVAGLVTIAYLLTAAGPILLCNLFPPPRCLAAQLSGVQYLTGDSQAAPVWHLTFNVVVPSLAIGASLLHVRRRFAGALVLAALACVPFSVVMFGTYLVVPFQFVIVGAVLVTFIGVSLGTIRAVWAPKPDATSA
jgi:hypothetical protein